MASYPYYSPPPPPSPPCNNTTSPILLPPPPPPPPPSPPPPPPACNHTATPTLSPPQSPPPPAQSPYSHSPPSLSPPPPTSPQKPPQWGPPPSSNYSQPKSPQPPSSPSPPPPPPSSYAYYSPPPPSSPCNTTTPTLQPPPPPPPACGCNKATPTLPSPPPPPPSSHSPPPPSPSHPSPPPPPPHRSPPSPPPPSSFPPQLHSPPPPPPHLSPSSPPPPSSFPPPLHSPPPPPSHPPPQSPPPPPPPPPSSPPSPPPKPSTPSPSPSPSPLSPDSPPCHCVCPSPWASPPNYWATPPNYNSIAPGPNFLSPSNGPRTPVLATFVSLGGLFFLSFIVIGLLSMAEKKGMLPFQFSRLLRRYSIPSGGRPEMGPPDLEQPEPSNTSGTDKMSSDPNLRKPPRDKSVMELMDAPPDDSVTDTADTSQDVEKAESNEVGEESNDSEKKRRLPKIKKPSRSGAKKRKDKHSGISQVLNTGCRQVLNTGCWSDLHEAEQPEDGENDEDENPEQRNAAEQETKNTKSAQDEGEGSNPVKEGSNERSDKPHSNPSEIKNTDATQDDAAKEDSNDSKRKLRPPNKGKASSSVMELMDTPADQSVTDTADTSQDVAKAESNEVGEERNDSEKKPRLPKIKKPSRSGAKERKDKHSGIRQVLNTGCRQVLNTGCCSDLQEAEQSQDGDKDEDENPEQRNAAEQETKNTKSAQDEGEGSNPVKEESNERSDKPHSNPSETNNTDATQDDAAKEDSNVSKRKSPPPNQGKASGSRRNPQGKRQPSRFGQLLNVAGNICHRAVQSQKDDNGEAGGQESEFQHDGRELNIGGSNNEDEGEESRSDERPGKSRINQSESDNREAAQYGEKEPEEGGEKSYGLENKSYESGKNSSQTKNPSGRPCGKQKLSEFSPALDGGVFNLGGPNDANENLESPSNVDDETSDEPHRNPLCKQSESDDIDVIQDVEQQSDAVKGRLISSMNKKKHSSRLTGKQKAPGVGQVSNAASTLDLDVEVQSQDNDKDDVEVHESEPQNDNKELEVGGTKNEPRGRQARTRARSREEPLNPIQLMSTGSGNDSSSAMAFLDDEEGKAEELEPFASARGGKQALSKAKVPDLIQTLTATNVDDSSEELTSVRGDDYKDDKAKVHELKFGGSKKDLRERQHRTPVREEVKLFNLQKIGTAVTGSDPGKALVSFDDEDDKVQQSEPIASNVDPYFLQPLSSAQGTDQSPNLVQNLTATINDDPNVELKPLGDRDYKGKNAEVYELSKDSRTTRGHIMGPRTRIEPPNLDQIVTARMGDDLGKGLESLGGNQFGKSYKDGSNKDVPGSGQTSRGTQQLPNPVQILTATNEDDPNPELEFCEDDKDLESEYSNKDLGIQETSPGEIEPSIDDQSVFATVDDDPDVLQFHNNEHDEELAESNKDARPGKPLSRPRTTSLRGKRRA